MPVYELKGQAPRFADRGSVWIAPDAVLVGEVTVGRNVSFWFGAKVRADVAAVTIGDDSNVQELSIFHADEGFPLVVGQGCTIGHGAMLHGCTIGDNTLVGMRAIILNGARIGRNSLVAAGTLVPQGRSYPDGVLIMGSPGKVVRSLLPDEIEGLSNAASHYVEAGRRYGAQMKRSWTDTDYDLAP
ncbi:gamma carbonic anhydrase family protein [Albidovulum sp.]|uniref:gamma carbonic anhydrase family protein n=1 Tax=Albidovulum sp. TaxID=1872424 RepID=UPI0039B9A874